MGPGRELQPEDGVLCGLPRDFRFPPLALESTEADENSPDPHRNSVSPPTFLPERASMGGPLKLSSHPIVAGKPTARGVVSDENSKHNRSVGADGLFDCSKHSSSDVNNTSQLPQQLPGCSANPPVRDRSQVQRPKSLGSLATHSDQASEASRGSLCDTETESDDGVAVYIDEVENDTCEALLITEHRISAKDALEIQAFKSKWVAQMVVQRDRILGISSDKVAVENRSNRNTALTGNTADAVPEAGCGLEFLQRKLEAFAECMSTEALECIQRNSRSWVEVSDSAESDGGNPHPIRHRLSKTAPESALSMGRGLPPTTKPYVASLVAKPQPQYYSNDFKLGVGPSLAALEVWGRFLKYARDTCKVVRPRPRIEQVAGLESDDDDEQAPLYMCRPGSVQRPSPLISHSLTEHLKASHTLFFKQFGKRVTSASSSLESRASAATPPAQEQQTNVVSASSTTVRTSAMSESVLPASDDGSHADANGTSETTTRDAVPLYQVTAKASEMFGDIMRLEDTVCMLEASCTFRLAAAPCSIIHKKNWQPKGPARVRTRRESIRTPSGTLTVELNSPSYRCNGHVASSIDSGVAVAASLNQRTATKPAAAPSRQALSQQLLVSSAISGGRGKDVRNPSEAAGKQAHGSRVVYTVQADEDALALSGLDSNYCSRVGFASQFANMALESLSSVELSQPNGNSLQESMSVSGEAQKKRRKAPVEDSELSSGNNDSDSECMPLGDLGSGTVSREKALEEDRSLMADKLLLAHLMPYLPQFGQLKRYL